MAGINRSLKGNLNLSETRKYIGVKCVFISHQKSDKEICKKIADYLLAADIDVYFDEYDESLKSYRQSNRPAGVVDSIKEGINKSSHMLIVVSPNTLDSKWVPWEVGYAYDNTVLSVLTLKGIQDNHLEDYLKTVPIIRGTKSLNVYISTIANISVPLLESSKRLMNHAISHPLDNYLDWNQ